MIAGYVLAGGRSTRLGIDKTRLCLWDKTTDLLHQTYANTKKILSHCWIVCRKEQKYHDMPYICDTHEGIGPIAGILSALLHAQKQHFSAILVLSCDLPFMHDKVIGQLLVSSQQTPRSMLTAFYNRQTQKIEMLAAVYAVTCIPLFINAIQKNHFKLNHVIPWTQRKVIYSDHKSERALYNINSPLDLQLALDMLSKMTGS